MKSNRKSPIWPYLLVLSGLFLFSLSAPRAWRPQATVRPQLATLHDAVTPIRSAPPTVLHAQPHDSWSPQLGLSRIEVATRAARASLFENPSDGPDVAVMVSPLTRFAANANLENDATGPNAETAARGMFVSLTDQSAAADADPDAGAVEVPFDHHTDDLQSSLAPDSPISQQGDPYDFWPIPSALLHSLDRLSERPETRAWSTATRHLLDRLHALEIDDPAAIDLLRELRRSANEKTANQGTEDVIRELERTRLDLVRRLEIWEPASAAARQQLVFRHDTLADPTMLAAVQATNQILSAAEVGATWRGYLMLERLAHLAVATDGPSPDQRRQVASVVLSRMTDPRLTLSQRELLARPELLGLKTALRRWAVEQLSVGAVLHLTESYEEWPLPSSGRSLALQGISLTQSQHPLEQELGGQLQRLYQGANVRLVVAGELLNRLLPRPEVQTDSVNETIVGVPARGYSTTSTKLSVRLFPATDQLRLGIEAEGMVDSQTATTSGPVTMYNAGQAQYFVGKLVALDRTGLRVGSAIAEADDRSRLLKMETDFDRLPLVGALVRNYALSQREDMLPQARSEVEAKVAGKATSRLDAEVNARIAKVESDYRRRVVEPLKRLDLVPHVVELSTTTQRATIRLRLAGDDQTAAHTARPMALSNSLASLQVHESAFNNALDRLSLAGRTFTLPELRIWIAQRLGREPMTVEDLPEQVVLTFADEDPVRVRCLDGRIELTFAIAELQQARRVWYDVEAQVCFEPQIAGRQLDFVRAGPIELLGEAYAGRAEIVLRGIFAKVFPASRKISFALPMNASNLALASLRFNSAIVDNGWISLTVADMGSP